MTRDLDGRDFMLRASFAIDLAHPRACRYQRHRGAVGRTIAFEVARQLLGRSRRLDCVHADRFVDLAAHFSDYEQLGAEDFGRLPEAARFGLTFNDFQRLKGKYGIVAASPIVDEKGRYLGCVTADFPVEGDHGTIPQAPVLESLMTTARLVVEVL